MGKNGGKGRVLHFRKNDSQAIIQQREPRQGPIFQKQHVKSEHITKPEKGHDDIIKTKEELVSRLNELMEKSESYLTRAIGAYAKGELHQKAKEYISRAEFRTPEEANEEILAWNLLVTEAARAKSAYDAAHLYRSVLEHDFIEKHPALFSTAVTSGVALVKETALIRLPPGELMSFIGTGFCPENERIWLDYDRITDPMKEHSSTLRMIGITIKDFGKVIEDAQQNIRVALLAAGLKIPDFTND